jgi:hypothetical protein
MQQIDLILSILWAMVTILSRSIWCPAAVHTPKGIPSLYSAPSFISLQIMKRCLAPSKAALRTWGKQQQFTDSCAGVFAGKCRYLSSIVSYNLPNADKLDYQLPPDRIAHHPIHPRDSSKLLICRPKESEGR